MQVTLRLPQQLLYQGQASKIYATAENGAFGILPKHSDLVTSLLLAVVVVTEVNGTERFFGVEQGLLIKHGAEVEIITQRSLEGDDLLSLATQMQQAFTLEDEEEREARSALAKLEIGMVKHLGALTNW